MSKADLLGKSSEFNRARTARSSRRQMIDATLGGDPTELPTQQISFNPDNPREHISDVSNLVDTIQEIGLVNPIVVASVAAYTRNRPERAGELEPGAEYVVVDGHRRLKAARKAGLPTIKVHVDDARVSTDEGLLEAAFVANVQRENMTDLEEAHALKTLVEFYGSQGKAAKRLGVSQGWISQRLSLLKLSPELQADLAEGRRAVDHVRNLAKFSPEEQRAKADERAEQGRQVSERRKEHSQPEPAPAAGEPIGTHYDVMGSGGGLETAEHPMGAAPTHYGVMTQPGLPPGGQGQPVPEVPSIPAPAQSATAASSPDLSRSAPTTRPKQSPAAVDWTDPESVARMLRSRMDPDHIPVLVALLT